MNYEFTPLSAQSTADDLEAVRNTSPLVHNITNYVVMNLTADALLAIGASPVMADAAEEVEEITAAAAALVLNTGTISGRWAESMFLSLRTAAHLGIPTVLDPVGAGFSRYRSDFIRRLLGEHTPTVIKGNPSEIMAVASIAAGGEDSPLPSKGVDTVNDTEDAADSAVSLARSTGSVVVVTGPTDYITDGVRLSRIRNGAEIMARTTGMGCTASALTGAFLAVTDDPFRGAVSAMAVMGIAGENAARHSSGNGSFRAAFLDELFNMNRHTITEQLIWED